jgi:hypothetical protein
MKKTKDNLRNEGTAASFSERTVVNLDNQESLRWFWQSIEKAKATDSTAILDLVTERWTHADPRPVYLELAESVLLDPTLGSLPLLEPNRVLKQVIVLRIASLIKTIREKHPNVYNDNNVIAYTKVHLQNQFTLSGLLLASAESADAPVYIDRVSDFQKGVRTLALSRHVPRFALGLQTPVPMTIIGTTKHLLSQPGVSIS